MAGGRPIILKETCPGYLYKGKPMLDWQIGKNKIFIRAISLVMAQVFFITTIAQAAPSERSLFKNKRVNHKAILEQMEKSLQDKKDALSRKNKLNKSIYMQDAKHPSHSVKVASLKELSSIYIPGTLGRVVEVYQTPTPNSELRTHL